MTDSPQSTRDYEEFDQIPYQRTGLKKGMLRGINGDRERGRTVRIKVRFPPAIFAFVRKWLRMMEDQGRDAALFFYIFSQEPGLFDIPLPADWKARLDVDGYHPEPYKQWKSFMLSIEPNQAHQFPTLMKKWNAVSQSHLIELIVHRFLYLLIMPTSNRNHRILMERVQRWWIKTLPCGRARVYIAPMPTKKPEKALPEGEYPRAKRPDEIWKF